MIKIDITIPCYNEAAVLKQNILKLHQWCQKLPLDIDWQIIIANNGSNDKTGLIAQELCQCLSRLQLFNFPKKGRGRTLKNVWLASQAEFNIYMDADLSTDLKAISKIIEELKENDLVIASRYLPESNVKRNVTRLLISKIYNFLIQKILKLDIDDTQCGFKGINQQIIQKILPLCQDNYWFFDTELIYWSFKKGLKVKEMPINWQAGEKSSVKIIRDIVIYLYSIIKFTIKNV